MNRRNFINSILTVGTGFTILPGAGRIWKVQYTFEWPFVETIYEIQFAIMSNELIRQNFPQFQVEDWKPTMKNQ